VYGKGVPFTNTRGSGGCYIDNVLGIAKIAGDINDVGTSLRSLWMKEDSSNTGQYIDMGLTRLHNLDQPKLYRGTCVCVFTRNHMLFHFEKAVRTD
jgi:hypothetical protein